MLFYYSDALILNLIFSTYLAFGITACKDDIADGNSDGMGSELPDNVAEMISDYNSGIAAYQKLFTGKHQIIDCISEENGGYRVMFSDKDAFTAYSNENLNTASTNNWIENTLIYGDAIREISTAGIGNSLWYGDASYFPGIDSPFIFRGGVYLSGSGSGLFYFNRHNGGGMYYSGFRAVVIVA